MTKQENKEFIRKTESLVKPEDVTAISFLGDFNKMLPKKTQDKIMRKGSEKIPYMGFIVGPYCFFMSYEITDQKAAQDMLPEGYELAESCLIQGSEKKPLLIVCAFTARTSAFIGMRLEYYIIARNKKTGLLSWIISDYESNTNSHDPKNGFCGYSCDPAVFTTTPYGELLVELRGKSEGRVFNIQADITQSREVELEAPLWVEGNLSVDYGGKLKDEASENFSLIFDPFLMKNARQIPLEQIQIRENSYMQGIIDGKSPLEALIFPFNQHFIIRQDLKEKNLKSEEEMTDELSLFLKAEGYKTMRGEDLKKPILRGMLMSSLINAGIILFLLIKLLS